MLWEDARVHKVHVLPIQKLPNSRVTGFVCYWQVLSFSSSETWSTFQRETRELTGSNTTLLIEARC